MSYLRHSITAHQLQLTIAKFLFARGRTSLRLLHHRTAMAPAADSPTSRGPVGQPDIDYKPNHATYLARIKRRQKSENLTKALPAGFPSKLTSDLVWDGKTVVESYDGVYKLNDAELKELDSALRHFQGELI